LFSTFTYAAPSWNSTKDGLKKAWDGTKTGFERFGNGTRLFYCHKNVQEEDMQRDL
jgi:hypothetical protein